MSDALAESVGLHARARARIDAYTEGRPAPEPFDVLAVDLARFQARAVDGYARLCASRGVDPAALRRAAEIPAVPTDAFKMAHVFAFPASEATVTFRTSGTTIGARGAHAMRDPGTYDAAALAFGRSMLLAELPVPVPVLVLGPSATDAPDSSLARMNGSFARAWSSETGAAPSTFAMPDRGGVSAVERWAGSLGRETPAIVLATSFALVHLLDALDGRTLPLPARSRVMHTGGTKGRSREVSRDALRAHAARAFAVDERNVIGEYGMTELSSQFWEGTVASAAAPRDVYLEPPWARVVPVHPETLAPVPDGEIGLARVEDLANVDSAVAVQTQDRVRRVAAGFELLGRAPGAPPRGCSIAIDEMLGRA